MSQILSQALPVTCTQFVGTGCDVNGVWKGEMQKKIKFVLNQTF